MLIHFAVLYKSNQPLYLKEGMSLRSNNRNVKFQTDCQFRGMVAIHSFLKLVLRAISSNFKVREKSGNKG